MIMSGLGELAHFDPLVYLGIVLQHVISGVKILDADADAADADAACNDAIIKNLDDF